MLLFFQMRVTYDFSWCYDEYNKFAHRIFVQQNYAINCKRFFELYIYLSLENDIKNSMIS